MEQNKKEKMKTKYVVVQTGESLKIKFSDGYGWHTKTFTNEELSDIFYPDQPPNDFMYVGNGQEYDN